MSAVELGCALEPIRTAIAELLEASRVAAGTCIKLYGTLIPLTPPLADIIERRWKARTVTQLGGTILADLVFHRDGRPVGSFRKAWASACKAAGVAGLLVHDLRRSAVRNFERAGVSQAVAMKITGHKTASVYRRYRIVDERDLREALAKTEAAVSADQTATVVPLAHRGQTSQG
jgi:integrase